MNCPGVNIAAVLHFVLWSIVLGVVIGWAIPSFIGWIKRKFFA